MILVVNISQIIHFPNILLVLNNFKFLHGLEF